jgi:hypothetical protein
MTNLLENIQLALTHRFEDTSTGSPTVYPFYYVIMLIQDKEVEDLKTLRHKIALARVLSEPEKKYYLSSLIKASRERAYDEILEIIELEELREDLRGFVKGQEVQIEVYATKYSNMAEPIELVESTIEAMNQLPELSSVKEILAGIEQAVSLLRVIQGDSPNTDNKALEAARLIDLLRCIHDEYWTRHTDGVMGPDAKYV